MRRAAGGQCRHRAAEPRPGQRPQSPASPAGSGALLRAAPDRWDNGQRGRGAARGRVLPHSR